MNKNCINSIFYRSIFGLLLIYSASLWARKPAVLPGYDLSIEKYNSPSSDLNGPPKDIGHDFSSQAPGPALRGPGTPLSVYIPQILSGLFTTCLLIFYFLNKLRKEKTFTKTHPDLSNVTPIRNKTNSETHSDETTEYPKAS